VHETAYAFLPPADERDHAVSASSHAVLPVNATVDVRDDTDADQPATVVVAPAAGDTARATGAGLRVALAARDDTTTG